VILSRGLVRVVREERSLLPVDVIQRGASCEGTVEVSLELPDEVRDRPVRVPGRTGLAENRKEAEMRTMRSNGMEKRQGKRGSSRRLTGCFAALLIGCLIALCSAPAHAQPPNILLILMDDFGIEHVDFYGIGTTGFAPTPSLTALAAEGLVFTEAWAHPICSSTKAAVQTGRYATRTGAGWLIQNQEPDFNYVGLPLEELTIPELLRDHTETPYVSAAFGKWHLGALDEVGGEFSPNLAGYDHFEGVFNELIDAELDPYEDYFFYPKTTNGVTEDLNGYMTEDFTNWTIDWINEQSEPWFAYVSHHAPHTPLHYPPKRLHTQVEDGRSETQFYAMVEAMDNEINRLLTSIDTTNTVVIFFSDNGSDPAFARPPVDPQKAKTTIFQGGIHVPFFIWGDGVAPGVSDALVNLTDIYATIGELAGATKPQSLTVDSVSVVPYFTDPALASIRDFAFTELFEPNGFGPYEVGQRTARDERYKVIRNLNGKEAMYDLWADRWETDNLLNGDLTPDQQAAYDAITNYMEFLFFDG